MAYGDYGKTTELEAVNILLGSIGEQPVSAIGSGVSKSTLARDLLYEQSRKIQSKGLNCNKDTSYTLEYDTDAETITIPPTAISVDPTNLSDNQFVERNSQLYDREEQTFTITRDVDVDIIWFLAWTYLPEHVRYYITVKAARLFQKRYLGDEAQHKFTEQDELEAKSEFDRKELNIADFSILDNTRVNPRNYRRG